MSGHFVQLHDFVQWPFCTKEIISYNNTGVTWYKDFLYEVVPNFYIHTPMSHFIQLRIICTRMFTFVDHTIYWKIDYKFPNPNKLSALVELNEIKWLRCTTLMMRWLIKRCFCYPTVYLWQEICAKLVVGKVTMGRAVENVKFYSFFISW